MSSDRQIRANGINAQRSTGPRTLAGKIKVSGNALKHGLTARDVVLPGENPDDFDSFRADLLTSFDLQGALEGALGEMIVGYLWRLRRVPIFEAMLYKRGCAELLVRQAEELVSQYESTTDRMIALLRKTGVEASDKQAYQDAEQKLARARAQLDDPSFNVSRVLQTSPEPFRNLWRHESALARSLVRNMHELERLQAKRAGQYVPVPEVVDVDLKVPDPSRADIERAGLAGEIDENT